MIRSMTSFARQELETAWGVLSWEIRTVNHRYLEVSLRLPEDFRAIETRMREQVGKKIKRSKVDGVLRFQPVANKEAGFSLDHDLIKLLLRAKGDVEQLLENPARTDSLDILKWPGVMQTTETDAEQLQLEALELLDNCVQELIENRLREGGKIKEMVEQRCKALLKEVADVRQRMPEIITSQRARLQSRLEELQIEVDKMRLEQEVAYLIQKTDVEEELDRLGVHIEEVQRVLGQEEPVGRRLDFLMQELNREANTLGSKSVDTETTRASVEMKVLIEQIREQIQNVE